ncbi:MAG: RNA polymerase sigma factor, partial [Myxococcales bacterium]
MPTAHANARILPETSADSSVARTFRAALPATAESAPVLRLVPRPLTDAELVARALRDDMQGRAAEEELYRRYRMAVQRLASTFSELDPDEVDDVVQESFVRAFRALKGLKDPERFSAWLFTIARNRARSYRTARSTHARAVEEATRESNLAEESVPAASVQLEREAELRAVREVIDGL